MALSEAELRELEALKKQSASLQQRFQPDAPVGTSQTKSLEGTEGLPLEVATGPKQMAGKVLETVPAALEIGAGMATAVPSPLTKGAGMSMKVLSQILKAGAKTAGASGAGGIIGEGVEIGGKQALGLEAPSTPLDIGKALAIQGGIGAVSDIVGTGVQTGVQVGSQLAKKFFWSPFKNSVVKGASKIDDKLKAYGTNLNAAQATQNAFLDMAHNVYAGAFISANKAEKAMAAHTIAGKEMSDKFVEGFLKKADTDDVGTLFITAVEDKGALASGAVNALYKGLDNMTGNVARVDFSPILGKLKAGDSKAAEKAFNDAVVGLKIKDISNLSFQEADKIRSAMGTKFYSTLEKSKGITTNDKKRIKEMINPNGALDEAMDIGATKYDFQRGVPGDTTTNQLKEARKASKEFHETFNSKVIKSLAEKDPIAVGEMLGKIKSVGQVKNIRQAVDKETFEQLKGNYVKKMISDSEIITDEVTPFFSAKVVGKKLNEILLNPKNPRQVQVEFLGNKAVRELHELADVLALTQSKGSQAMNMAIQFTQFSSAATALTGVATGDWQLAAGGMLALYSPRALGAILESESGRRILLKGLPARATKGQITKYTTQLASILAADKSLNQAGALGDPVRNAPEEIGPSVRNPNLPEAQGKRKNFLQQLGQLKGIKQ